MSVQTSWLTAGIEAQGNQPNESGLWTLNCMHEHLFKNFFKKSRGVRGRIGMIYGEGRKVQSYFFTIHKEKALMGPEKETDTVHNGSFKSVILGDCSSDPWLLGYSILQCMTVTPNAF